MTNYVVLLIEQLLFLYGYYNNDFFWQPHKLTDSTINLQVICMLLVSLISAASNSDLNTTTIIVMIKLMIVAKTKLL